MARMTDELRSNGAVPTELRLVGGRYRLLERLGHGGMGTVWRAMDERMRRYVAVKEPLVPEGLDPVVREELFRRMQREAQAAAAISHPQVVRVHDIETVDGCPWLVMELIDGESLADLLASGTVGVSEAARIGAQIADALAAVHAAGVVHRDVKPGNIMLTASGQALLTDFGIARIDGQGDLTRTGQLVGSLPYLSPERATGRRAEAAGDLWALGLVLYEAVEGTHPFRRNAPEATLISIVQDALPESRRAGRLRPVITLLLAKEPERRPDAATARELLRMAAEEPVVEPGDPTLVLGAGRAGAGTVPPTRVLPPTALPDAGGVSLPPADQEPGRLRGYASTWRGRSLMAGAAVAAVGGGFLASYLTGALGGGPVTPAKLPSGYTSYALDGGSVAVAVPGDYTGSPGDTRGTWLSKDGNAKVDLRVLDSGGRSAKAWADDRVKVLQGAASGSCVNAGTGMAGFAWVDQEQPVLHSGASDGYQFSYSYTTTREDSGLLCPTTATDDRSMEEYIVTPKHAYVLTVTFVHFPANAAADSAVYSAVSNSLAFRG
jgi:hypothetical protein